MAKFGAPFAELFREVLAFVGEIATSIRQGDLSGAIVRLLIIVEVLLTFLAFVGLFRCNASERGDLIWKFGLLMVAAFLLVVVLLTFRPPHDGYLASAQTARAKILNPERIENDRAAP